MEVNIKNRLYHYDVSGTGPALLLLHGFTGKSQTWQPFLTKWSNHYTVIRMDMPGHGSTICEDFPTMSEFCDDLSEFLDHLQVSTANIIGYSMGGRAALAFASMFPRKVKTLILESASPGLQTETEQTERIRNDERLAERIETEGLLAFVNRWESTPLFGTQKNLPVEVKQQIRLERLGQTATGLAHSLEFMGTGMQQSVWYDLQSMRFPVLLLAGSLDSKFVKINELMHEHLENSQFEIINGIGHAIHVENPSQFDTVVIDFLKTEYVSLEEEQL